MLELSVFHIRVVVPTESCISKDGGKEGRKEGEAAWGPGGVQSCNANLIQQCARLET